MRLALLFIAFAVPRAAAADPTSVDPATDDHDSAPLGGAARPGEAGAFDHDSAPMGGAARLGAFDRVFAAPTAWLPPGGAILATSSLDLRALADKRVDTGVNVGVGLGDIAAVEVGTDTDVRGCAACDKPAPLNLGRAQFRLGAPQDALFHGMPAVLLGVRTTYARRGSNGKASPFAGARATDAYAVASRVLGPVRVHAGASVTDASFTGDAGDEVTLGLTVRPLAGLEWTPSQYPKTSLMGDLVYVPRFERDPDERVAIEWMAGLGVRYQAFPWGAIELAVRVREGEGLGDGGVLVRLDGVWNATRTGKATPPR